MRGSMFSIKFYEVFDEERFAIEQYFSDENILITDKTIQESNDQNCPADIICIRTQSIIPIGWSEKLKGIFSRSQGFDHLIDYQRKVKISIPLGYLSSYCSRSVAEHAIMSMMVLMKKLKKQINQFDEFNRSGLMGEDCFRKSALIIGVGNIGYQIYQLAKALGMNVSGVDINRKYPDVSYIDLCEGLANAEIIFVAADLNDSTAGLINHTLMNINNKNPYFINISRGEISPMVELKKLLDENIIAGAALDVYEQEAELAGYLRRGTIPKSETNKIVMELKLRDNVLFTPHNAFNTANSVLAKAKLTKENIDHFHREGRFITQIE